ncbi:MAG: hypothetical protein M1819_007314 [Sarea resinae]|nr:MAG: hypothetical protein M1819_007314 [Sarea resinae]
MSASGGAAINGLKRPSPSGPPEPHVAKRMRIHHHQMRHRSSSPRDGRSDLPDPESIQDLLTRSLVLALEAVGFDAADPVALESFRGEVDEYLTHLLSKVTQSMLSCRRTQPIPQDIDYAFAHENIPLSYLNLHLQPPVPASKSQISLPSPPPEESPAQNSLPFLGPDLDGSLDKSQKPYIPSHFPPFPSKHTYRATADFTERDKDPRAIRERATEEGRLGEESLRKLVGAMKAGGRNPMPGSSEGRGKRRYQRLEMFKKTMEAVSKSDAEREGLEEHMDIDMSGNGVDAPATRAKGGASSQELGIVVNSERGYWRKGAFIQGPELQKKGPAISGAESHW